MSLSEAHKPLFARGGDALLSCHLPCQNTTRTLCPLEGAGGREARRVPSATGTNSDRPRGSSYAALRGQTTTREKRR
jgi:hypothetical protein